MEIISVHSFEIRIYSKFSFLCVKILNYCLMNCGGGSWTSCPEIVTGNRRDFDGWYKNGLLFPNALCLTTTKKLMIYAWCHQFTNAHIKKMGYYFQSRTLVLGNHTWTLKLTSHSVTRGSHILRSCNPMAPHSARVWVWTKESLIWVSDATLRVSLDLNI